MAHLPAAKTKAQAPDVCSSDDDHDMPTPSASKSDEPVITGASSKTGGKGSVKKVPADFQRRTGSTDFAAFRAWRAAKKKVEAGKEPELRKYKDLLQPHVDTLKQELSKMKDDIVKNSNDNTKKVLKNFDDNTWKLAKFQEQLQLSAEKRATQHHQEVMKMLGAALPSLAGSSGDHMKAIESDNSLATFLPFPRL